MRVRQLRVLAAGATVALALVATGCADSSLSAGHALQDEVLADGQVTAAEYLQVQQASIDCMTDRGLGWVPDPADPINVEYLAGMIEYRDHTESDAGRITVDCSRAYSIRVSDAWHAQGGGTVAVDVMSATKHCMAEQGYEASPTAIRFTELAPEGRKDMPRLATAANCVQEVAEQLGYPQPMIPSY